jgi:hypothetical protein
MTAKEIGRHQKLCGRLLRNKKITITQRARVVEYSTLLVAAKASPRKADWAAIIQFFIKYVLPIILSLLLGL